MRGFTVALGAGARVLGAWMDAPEVTVAGAAFDQPVAFRCGSGDLPLGDWSDYALVCDSGEVYSRTVVLTLQQRITLDLGGVAVGRVT